ncbi:MAG: hypothetical protein AB6733_23325 [Clostridiaceae bacterium]
MKNKENLKVTIKYNEDPEMMNKFFDFIIKLLLDNKNLKGEKK